MLQAYSQNEPSAGSAPDNVINTLETDEATKLRADQEALVRIRSERESRENARIAVSMGDAPIDMLVRPAPKRRRPSSVKISANPCQNLSGSIPVPGIISSLTSL